MRRNHKDNAPHFPGQVEPCPSSAARLYGFEFSLLVKILFFFFLALKALNGNPNFAYNQTRRRRAKGKEIQKKRRLNSVYHHQKRHDAAKQEKEDRNRKQSFRMVEHY